MTVEAEITRSLGIRFIDARILASEAKLAQGIVGYASKEQLPSLVSKAAQIFESKPEEEKETMRKLNDDLESIKSSHHSRASLRPERDDDSTLEGSVHTSGSTTSFSSIRGMARRNSSGVFRKVVSLGMLRKNQLPKAASAMKNATFSSMSTSCPKKENPLLHKVHSTGGMVSLSSKTGMLSSSNNGGMAAVEKRNRMARVDRLGEILDISIQVSKANKQPLECIKSGTGLGLEDDDF